MKKNTILFLLSLISYFPIQAQVLKSINDENKKYSLKELIDKAIKCNYAIQSNQLNDSLTIKDLKYIGRNYLPKFSSQTNVSYWNWLQPNKQKMLGEGNTDALVELSAYQLLYDWGLTKQEKKVSLANISINKALRRQIEQNIALAVISKYLDICKQRNKIEIYKSTISRLKNQEKIAHQLYHIGKKNDVDLHKIQLALALKDKDLMLAQAGLKEMMFDLKYFTFLPQETTLNLKENIDDLFHLHEKYIQNIGIIESHPSLAILDEKIKQQKLQQRLFKKQNTPKLHLFAKTSWESSDIPFRKNFNYNVGISLKYTLPLLGAGGYKDKIDKSTYQVQQLKFQREETVRDLEAEIASHVIKAKSALKDIKKIKMILSMSDHLLKKTMVLYESGQENILNLLEAQSTLTEQSLIYKETMKEYLLLVAKINFLRGLDQLSLINL